MIAQIILGIVNLLLAILPSIAKMIESVDEVQAGGIESYDKLLGIAYEQVQHVAKIDWPGDTDAEQNMKRYLEAAAATAAAASAVGLAVRDSTVKKAVNDAVVMWKAAVAKGEAPPSAG